MKYNFEATLRSQEALALSAGIIQSTSSCQGYSAIVLVAGCTRCGVYTADKLEVADGHCTLLFAQLHLLSSFRAFRGSYGNIIPCSSIVI